MMQLSKIFCIFALALTQNHLLYYLQNITLMEKHHSQPRKAQFPFSISEKSVMGGYFNIARLNFYKTIVTIFAQVGVKGEYPEDKIDRVLDALYKNIAGKDNELSKEQAQWKRLKQLKGEQITKLQRLLFNHFPVLGPIMASEASYKIYKSELNAKEAEDAVQNDKEELKKIKKSNVINNEQLMRGVGIDDCLNVLATMAACLTDCRNYYSHYIPYNSIEDQKKQYKRQAQIARWLDKVIVASRRIDKQRNSLTTNEMEFLTGIDHYFQQDKKDDTGKLIRDEKGRTLKEFVEYPDYYFRIKGERQLVDIAGKTLNEEQAQNALTDFGIVFFCTLFLQKTYAKMMQEELKLYENGPYRGDVKGKENDDAKKNTILREMLSIYRIRVPRGKRLDSKDDATTLSMDMLNELRKCPMPLYDVLGKDGQRFFEDEVQHPNEQTPEKVKRLRATDRFPHLALRYIDLHDKTFTRIRFQVQLGNFRFKFYNKKTIDGAEEVRSIQKEINGYGRLQEIEAKRLETYAPLFQKSELVSTKLEHEDLNLDLVQFTEDHADSKPYITNHRATYNIHNNRIGMYWEASQNVKEYKVFSSDGMYLPTLNTIDGKAPISMPAPKASLSIYELPAMLFYQYLLDNNNVKKNEYDAPQDILINKHDALVKFFEAVRGGELIPALSKDELSRKLESEYDLKISEVPNKLVDYLIGKEDNGKRLYDYATHEVLLRLRRSLRRFEHFEEDRKMIGSKDNKYGKKGFVDVRHGRLAQYLAESIMDWRKPLNGEKDKLTGLNYSKMQAALATFGGKTTFDKLNTLFKEAGLYDNRPGSHPFLQSTMQKAPQNIEMLYLAYLEAETDKLKKFVVIKNLNNLSEKELKEYKDLVTFTVKEKRTYSDGRTKMVMVDKVAVNIIGNTNFANLPFIHHQRARFAQRNAEYYKSLAGRYLSVDGKSATIQLPDGIFTKHILKLLKEKYATHEALQLHLTDDDMNHNAAYLISSFFETVLNDCSQPYYRTFHYENNEKKTSKFAHIYDLFNILNNVKEANAYKPYPMTTDDINSRLTKKATNRDGLFVIRKDDNGEDYLVKQITLDIENHLKKMEDAVEAKIKFKNLYGYNADKARKNGAEEREKMLRKLTHCISDVKNNERAIRRYKTQDMVLFLLAKSTLSTILAQQNGVASEELFRLKNVCNNNFLSQTVRFEFPIKVNEMTIKVVQENMALKNYGEFYRFINDDRLMSLLTQLKDVTEISYADLTGELATYDLRRSQVFRLMQELEKIAFEQHTKELTNIDNSMFFKDGDMNNVPRRNNFKALINLFDSIDSHQLTKDDCERLVEIRNAFCHNTYRINIDDLQEKLPTIAIQIVGKIENLLKGADMKK